jgi:hypothetical protein
MRLKASLDPSFSLGAVRINDFNAQLFDGPAKLGQGLTISQLLFNTGLAIDLVDRILVYVKG